MKRTHSLYIFLLCSLLILIPCLTPSAIVGASSNSQLSVEFLSHGRISYSSTTSNLDVGDASSWNLIGDDYLLYSSNNRAVTPPVPNGNPNIIWTSQKLSAFVNYDCSVAKLGFGFASTPGNPASIYDKEKMDIVLTKLDSVGVKAVLCLMMGWGQGDYFGSQQMVDDWVQVAIDYGNDPRVVGFSVFEEPWDNNLAASGPVGAINSKAQAHKFMGYLIEQIRTVDPTKTPIIYPIMWYFGFGSSPCYGVPPDMETFYHDLEAYGILSKENIIYDICHPYCMENETDQGLSPTDLAAWYMHSWVLEAATYIDVKSLWIGETFPWSNDYSSEFSDAHQIEFSTAMLNECIEHSIGLDMWGYFSSTWGKANYDTAIQNSNW